MERWAAAACADASASSVESEERTPGRVSTACMASSRTQTQSWTSCSGRLQSSAKRATFDGTSSRVVDSGQGRGSAYWPKARRARWPAADPNCMPRNTGPSVTANCEEQAAESARRVVAELAQVHRGGNGGGALLLGLDHRLEDGTVGLEHLEGPLPRPDRVERDPGPGSSGPAGPRDAGHVGHVELGHPGQLLEGDAHQRVGVVVDPSVGGDAEGEGAGRLEPAVAPARRGSRSDDLEQVAEQAPHRVVGIDGAEHGQPMLRPEADARGRRCPTGPPVRTSSRA